MVSKIERKGGQGLEEEEGISASRAQDATGKCNGQRSE